MNYKFNHKNNFKIITLKDLKNKKSIYHYININKKYKINYIINNSNYNIINLNKMSNNNINIIYGLLIIMNNSIYGNSKEFLK